jgi:ADP-heptose:LPS heptosyltransferase/predicted SAM-dependent methyltransferase
MTWRKEAKEGDESSKIRWELVPYMLGRCLDLGCGPWKVFPHFVGVDNGHHWGTMGADVAVETAEDLSIFATQSHDCVYSSHLLEHIPPENVTACLQEWMRVLKNGGYLVLYLPDEDEYPKVGEYGANKDHKWNVNYQRVVDYMAKTTRGWDLVDFQKRNQDDEYSLFFVFKVDGHGHRFSHKKPKPTKTCAVIRYGAIGDALIASSVLPGLKAEGYHVTLYCQKGPGYEVVKHDPHVDRFIIQGKDNVPPQFLKEFWDYTKKKYDKWVNLCESMEVTLLAAPGRTNHEWPNSMRAKFMDKNYLEFVHGIAEVPPPYTIKFHSTPEEKKWARDMANRWGKRNILWSLSGSSGHKTWPHMDAIIARIMLAYKDAHVTLVGDGASVLLQAGWEKEPRVHCMVDKWTIRQTMAFAEVSSLVIGPETGVMNGASQMPMPKIITLSHSSKEMLTKHWTNTIALEQPEGVGCKISPCRLIHYSWEYCFQEPETGASLCQYHITAEMMWDAVTKVFGQGSIIPIARAA